MKAQQIIVPKNECALDVLAGMKEQTKDAWIYLHVSVVKKLGKTANIYRGCGLTEMTWEATPNFPRTILDFGKTEGNYVKVRRIYAEDIAFRLAPMEPQSIIFMKMEG